MSDRIPTIAEVRCERIRFEPGDRLIVRLRRPVNRDQRGRLLRSVQKFAGPDVEVLLVDLTLFDVEVEKRGKLSIG